MSVQALAWAIEDAPGVPGELVSLLIGLANHADEDGRNAYPSLALLADYTRRSERQVRRGLRMLEDLGLIRAGDQRLTGHLRPGHRPAVYDLSMANLGARRAEREERRRRSEAGGTSTSPQDGPGGGTWMTGLNGCGGTPTSPGGGTWTSAKPSLEPSTKTPPTPQPLRGQGIDHNSEPPARPSPCSRTEPAHANCRGCGTTRRAMLAAVEAKPQPPWCGACSDGTYRMVDVEGGVAKCRRCHPDRVRTATG